MLKTISLSSLILISCSSFAFQNSYESYGSSVSIEKNTRILSNLPWSLCELERMDVKHDCGMISVNLYGDVFLKYAKTEVTPLLSRLAKTEDKIIDNGEARLLADNYFVGAEQKKYDIPKKGQFYNLVKLGKLNPKLGEKYWLKDAHDNIKLYSWKSLSSSVYDNNKGLLPKLVTNELPEIKGTGLIQLGRESVVRFYPGSAAYNPIFHLSWTENGRNYHAQREKELFVRGTVPLLANTTDLVIKVRSASTGWRSSKTISNETLAKCDIEINAHGALLNPWSSVSLTNCDE